MIAKDLMLATLLNKVSFVRDVKSRTLSLLLIVIFFGSNSVFAIGLEEELKLGAEQHKKIIAQFGVYRDKELQNYIEMVGKRVAAQSSRPELEYHFTILNDDMINAFAVPGGYVYVTRGMLMHMNSESELSLPDYV